MAYIDHQLCEFKAKIESAIVTDGVRGKESMIRSSKLINLIHDAVKYELIQQGVSQDLIFPHLNDSKPELKLAGFYKPKDQDICVIPSDIAKTQRPIAWGPYAYSGKTDEYGAEFTENTLAINVRSQMSSLAKNVDTLMERTYSEASNLHMQYPKIVLGEVYLIPVYEYDDEAVKINQVQFKKRATNVAYYISAFSQINGRLNSEITDYRKFCSYEKCALLVVDFSREVPKLYRNSAELKIDNVIPADFPIEYADLAFDSFAQGILNIYASRFNINNILATRV